MKKYLILYIILFFAGSVLPGCEGYLKESPQNKLKPSTTDDYDQLLNRAYITRQIMPYLDILSDDIDLIAKDRIEGASNNADILHSAYMWDSSHELSMPGGDMAFEKLYESILYTNIVIDNVDDAVGTILNEAKVQAIRQNIKGEAMVLRAYSYFYLINLYAAAYDPATAEEAPGIPINLSTAAEDKPYPRNTIAEVYEQIVTDFTEGIRLMEENPIEKAAKIKFDPLTAKAMLARTYLYMHEWDLAIRYATEVLAENHNIFNLFEAGEKLNIDNNSSGLWDKETSLWGQDYLSRDNANVLFVNGVNELVPYLSYWPYMTVFSVNQALADQFEPEDVRRFYFMSRYRKELSGDITIDKLCFAKNRFKDLSLTMRLSPESGYSRVIRVEEMYLIIAEAQARKSTPDIPASIAALNTLREPKFRSGLYTPLKADDFNQQSLIDFIAVERRRELCFEGHRWFDLRRTTRPAMTRIGYEDKVASLEKDDPRYVLQIPIKEISVNPAIGLNPR